MRRQILVGLTLAIAAAVLVGVPASACSWRGSSNCGVDVARPVFFYAPSQMYGYLPAPAYGYYPPAPIYGYAPVPTYGYYPSAPVYGYMPTPAQGHYMAAPVYGYAPPPAYGYRDVFWSRR